MILRWSMVWIFLSIVLIIITISFVTFEIAFRRTKKVWEFPDRECYNKYKEEVLKAKEKLENSECEEIYITSFDKTKLFGRLIHAFIFIIFLLLFFIYIIRNNCI